MENKGTSSPMSQVTYKPVSSHSGLLHQEWDTVQCTDYMPCMREALGSSLNTSAKPILDVIANKDPAQDLGYP